MMRFILLGLALCAAILLPSSLPGLFGPADHALDDWRTRFVMSPRPEARIVIVDVDERSLAEQGAWPWPRATIARLLRILIDKYGVAGIAVDMVFPEVRPDDAILAAQFRRPQMTGSVVFDLEQRMLPALRLALPPELPLQATAGAPLISGLAAVTNHAALMPPRAGHITPVFDSDGAVRRLPPMICRSGHNCRPGLALAAFAGLADNAYLTLHPGSGLLSPAWQLALKTGDHTALATLPLSDDGMLTIPYRHSSADWIAVSASDILMHKADPAVLKGVMVLLGGTALGLADVIATPVRPVTAGLEPHAEVLSALLDNDFPFVPQWGLLLDAALLLPFALLLAGIAGRYARPLQRAVLFPVWLLLTWAACAALSITALRSANLLLPLTPLLLFAPLALLLLLSTELYRTGRDSIGARALLSAYLPRQVAQRLAAFGKGEAIDTTVDASRREITVFFADIRGFAGLCEGRPPEIVARLMQRVFSEMADAVIAHHGTIDKFIGDAIMAFWNAFDDDPQHAAHALAAAQEIQRRMAALAPFCAELDMPPIRAGIGMETGAALVGNFGSAHRRTFTALGEPVILASRIERLTSTHQQPVLIGETCAAALGQFALRSLGPIQIRGRAQPIVLYAPE
ncbi:MAG TPA: adenylate/guanylate cyclase domain-containing protein [Paucimonas sp.]|nr:adenylate/guanylate cyclase domain-containing protein [Paucimonas sp.]HJW54821.1 adenylate/guanylate cyclase domain-containing protein [Burkholderiaceae bacterium]